MKLSSFLAVCIITFSSFAFSMQTISIGAVSTTDLKAQQFLSYNFGQVWVNSMNRVIFQIRNTGALPIEREGFSISGVGYEAYTNCPTVIPSGMMCKLEIRYWPPFEGSHFGRMQMLFTDKNDIIINLYGSARRY